MRLLVSAVSLFLSLSVLADCSCCGCSGDSGEGCLWAMTNYCQNACSSNCVKMTPSECVQLKENIKSTTQSINGLADSVINDIDMFHQSVYGYDGLIPRLDSMLSIVQNLTTMQDVASTNQEYITSALSSLSSALDVAARAEEIALSVELPLITGRYLIYTNILNGSFLALTRSTSFGNRFKVVTNHLHSAISTLQQYGSIDLSSLNSVSSTISTLRRDIVALDSNLISNSKPNLQAIKTQSAQLGEIAMNLNCNSCGQGSTGSGGSDDSGGGSSNIDLSPVVAELIALQEKLDYWMSELLSLISTFFSDYSHASDNPVSSRVPLDTLSQNKNWFSRIEQMLFNGVDGVSSFSSDYEQARVFHFDTTNIQYGVGDSATNWFMRVEQLLGIIAFPSTNTIGSADNPTEPPTDLSDTEEVEDLDRETGEANDKSDYEKDHLSAKVNEGWNSVQQAFSRFVSSFSAFGFAETNIDGMSLEMYLKTEDGDIDLFHIPQGLSSRLQTVRAAFNVIWLLMCLVLYIYAFKLLLSVILVYVAWFLKLAAATFGE